MYGVLRTEYCGTDFVLAMLYTLYSLCKLTELTETHHRHSIRRA